MTDAAFALDPLGEEYRSNPAVALRRAREVAPLHHVAAMDCWFAVEHGLVRELYTHSSFTNDQRAWKGWQPPTPGSVREWSSKNSLFAKTGSEHARTRRLASHAFTPAAVKRMTDRIAEVCDEYAVRMNPQAGEVVDLAAEYTQLIPNTVISRVLGVAPLGDDERRFRDLAAAPLRLANPLADADERRMAEDAAEELVAYVRELTEQRRDQPGDDMVTDLVNAYDADDKLTDDEVVLTIFALLAAGTDTTTFAATYGFRSLIDHPEQLQLLKDRPDLLPNAVLELLRFEVGGGALPRFALEDVEVAGREIHQGDLVFLSPLGAHRDPAVFEEPDRLDIERDTTDVIVFGHGPHYCLGANLAKGELIEMYRRGLDFLSPDSRVLHDDVAWSGNSVMFRSLSQLPVVI